MQAIFVSYSFAKKKSKKKRLPDSFGQKKSTFLNNLLKVENLTQQLFFFIFLYFFNKITSLYISRGIPLTTHPPYRASVTTDDQDLESEIPPRRHRTVWQHRWWTYGELLLCTGCVVTCVQLFNMTCVPTVRPLEIVAVDIDLESLGLEDADQADCYALQSPAAGL